MQTIQHSKRATRAETDALVRDFLERGGEITVIKTGRGSGISGAEWRARTRGEHSDFQAALAEDTTPQH